MTTLLFQLQAPLAPSIFILVVAVILTIAFPVVWFTTAIRKIRKSKSNGQSLNWKTYSFSIITGLVYAILMVLTILLIVYFLVTAVGVKIF